MFFQARVETAASTPDVQRMASPHVSAVLLFIRLSVSCWHAKELQNRSRFGGCCNGQHNDLHGYGKIPLRQILNQRRAHRSNAVVQPQLEHGAKRCQLSTGRTADAVRSWASRCPPPGRISGGNAIAGSRHHPDPAAWLGLGHYPHLNDVAKARLGDLTPRKRRDPPPRLLALTQKTVVTQRRVGGRPIMESRSSPWRPCLLALPFASTRLRHLPFRDKVSEEKKGFS